MVSTSTNNGMYFSPRIARLVLEDGNYYILAHRSSFPDAAVRVWKTLSSDRFTLKIGFRSQCRILNLDLMYTYIYIHMYI